MAFDSYEEFDEQMGDILSSGYGFEMSNFHKEQLTELFSGMDRDALIGHLNRYYDTQEPNELREGELSWIAEHLNGKVSAKITFE